MAEYEMQVSNLPNKDGKSVVYPRMRLYGQLDLEEVVRRMTRNSTFSPAEVKGMVQALTEEIALCMADGYSVKVGGLGVFTPALGLRDGVEREEADADMGRRNASSICVSNVNFKADKELVRRVNKHCRLKRSARKFRRSSDRYTPKERLGLALEYLESHPYLTVGAYEALTGLLHSRAAEELRTWAGHDDTGIASQGVAPHRVYVRRRMP